jgi:hypothetical protein
VSGRRRFNCYSDQTVEQEGERLYRAIMQDSHNSLLPEWDPRSRMADRVMAKLIPASGLVNVNVWLPWQVVTGMAVADLEIL